MSLDSRFWEKYFKTYDVLNLVLPYRQLLQEILKRANINNNDLVLEAGVGTGNLAILIEKAGAKVVGLDFSEAALNIYKQKNPSAKIIFSDLNNKLPFLDNTFDVVISNNTLYNIDRNNRLKVLIEMKRVLKQNGKIILSNIHKGFSPLKIYMSAIVYNIKTDGVSKTVALIIKLLIPTIKMFYYNFIIQKEHKFNKNNLFEYQEQKELLVQAGFADISDTVIVYAGQGVLNAGIKSSL